MAKTFSNRMELGTKAPYFNLINVITNQYISLDQLKGEKGTVVMFICNHCPYVIHVNSVLVLLANEYEKKGIRFIAISSNDVLAYPQDEPEKMKIHAIENNYPFPYLYDEFQDAAKAYDAACTPDIFVFDADLLLYYQGQIDDSRPNSKIPVTGNDIKQAFEYLLRQEKYPFQSKPSMGCNIKWK